MNEYLVLLHKSQLPPSMKQKCLHQNYFTSSSFHVFFLLFLSFFTAGTQTEEQNVKRILMRAQTVMSKCPEGHDQGSETLRTSG